VKRVITRMTVLPSQGRLNPTFLTKSVIPETYELSAQQ